ncbi:unnamed protein product [Cochlearia groenlandica]
MRIKLSIKRDKCRRKAMEVAVSANGNRFGGFTMERTTLWFLMEAYNVAGVVSVAIEGEYEDELVVVGDGVDAACLVQALRKKACYASLESLEEVTPDILSPNDDDDEQPQEVNDTDESINVETADDDNSINQMVPTHCCVAHCPSFHYQQPRPAMYEVVYDSYGPSNRCTIT